MASENQAWMYPSTTRPTTTTTKPTYTPAQLAAQERLRQQRIAESSSRVAGDFLQESIRENIAAGGLPWDPTGGLGRRITSTGGGGGGFDLSGFWRGLGGLGGGSNTKKEESVPSLTLDYAGDGKNIEQLRAMYASALAELQRQQAEGGGNILRSVDRMRNDPMNNANAYARLQAVAPTVVGNPLAQYAEATGISTDMADKSQQLANADAQAYQGATQNVYDIMSASQQAANQSRMADIGMMETGANQDLVAQANMMKLLLNQRETTDTIALQQRNLENAINQRNVVTQQIQSIFGKDGAMGGKLKPEEILKLIDATLAKMNTGQWGGVTP